MTALVKSARRTRTADIGGIVLLAEQTRLRSTRRSINFVTAELGLNKLSLPIEPFASTPMERIGTAGKTALDTIVFSNGTVATLLMWKTYCRYGSVWLCEANRSVISASTSSKYRRKSRTQAIRLPSGPLSPSSRILSKIS